MDTTLHGLAAKIGSLVLLQAISTFLADDAKAQSNACDQLKGVLAARIEASGVRGYALEAVPAGTPVPPDARVIGTCEAARYKVLYRRGGGKPAAPAPSPEVQAVQAVPAVTNSNEGASAPRAQEPVKAVSASASEAAISPATDRRAEQPAQQPPLQSDSAPTIPVAQRASDFVAAAAANWRWLIALILVPIAGWLWAWRVHRNAYDKYGLPRGPKL
jgi:hypothetical protein